MSQVEGRGSLGPQESNEWRRPGLDLVMSVYGVSTHSPILNPYLACTYSVLRPVSSR